MQFSSTNKQDRANGTTRQLLRKLELSRTGLNYFQVLLSPSIRQLARNQQITAHTSLFMVWNAKHRLTLF